MQCQVDPNMEITATTQASWYGAPGPLFCGPTSTYPTTGYWDYTYMCDYSWEDPPRYCTDYVGQKGGRYDNSEVVMNRNNRTDVMGCCWWGRGYVCCVYIFNIFIFSSLYVLILLLLLLLVMMLLLLLLLALSSSSSNSIAFLVAYLFLFWVCSYPPQISPPSLGHVFCRVIQTTGKKFPNAFLLSAVINSIRYYLIPDFEPIPIKQTLAHLTNKQKLTHTLWFLSLTVINIINAFGFLFCVFFRSVQLWNAELLPWQTCRRRGAIIVLPGY